MRKVKVSAVQMKCTTDVWENIANAEKFVRQAKKDGANIVLLPELFERQDFCQERRYDYYNFAKPTLENDAVKHFAKLAKELEIVIPVSFYERDGNRLFNSAAVIDADGEILGVYRKTHIPDDHYYQEKFYFIPGDTGFKTFKTKFGTIGIGICWDQWFPEVARILALKGAEIIVYPTAIGSEPVLPKDSKDHWQNVMKGHASANILPVLASNRVGVEKAGQSSMKFFGSSFIADQHGCFAAEMNREEEGFRLAEFDLEAIDKERADWGSFRDRRVDLYGDLLHLDASKK